MGLKSGKGFYSYPSPVFELSGFLDNEGDASIPHLAMTTALVSHAILLASNDVASPEEIDRAWMVGMTLDTGPFELLQSMGGDAFQALLHSEANTLSPSDTRTVEEYLEQYEEGGRARA